jgi:tRNA (adenine57-N1/adenine58-N1)-methyltransferase catalytic subunit
MKNTEIEAQSQKKDKQIGRDHTQSLEKAFKRMLYLENGESYYIKDATKDFHCSEGFVTKEALAKVGEATLSSGMKCFVSEFTFSDSYAKIKRGAQIILQKDAGLILAQTLVGRDDIVIDAGSGSGALTAFLARYVKHVHSCDVKDDHIKTSRKNVTDLGLDNVTFYNHDVYTGFPITRAQLITLDVPQPHLCLDNAYKTLDSGRYLVCYVPCINQVHELIKSVDISQFSVLKSVEIIERYWKVTTRAVRPETNAAIHTGFLVFLRRI